jgi:putative hydrolase of the HAD superfamily
MVTQAILFDLFGTLVHFNVRVPVLNVAGTYRHSTMPWLSEAFSRELPGVCFESFLDAITAVTAEIIRQRPPDYVEVPSRLRFERALVRMGIDGEFATGSGERLSLQHMKHLASSVELPAGYGDLLRSLRRRFRFAVVSNFDHAVTAQGILDRFHITPLLDTAVISEDFGRRKPHPDIFVAALERMAIERADAVFVGDSPADDLVGAKRAGLRVIWVNPDERALPADAPAPDAVVRTLAELPELLR